MKLGSLLLLALGAVAGAVSARPAAPPATPRQDLHQQAYDDFVKRFKEFLAVKDTEGMASLVRKTTDVAVRFADTLCQQIAVAGSEDLERQIAALRQAWRTAHDTAFVDNIYEYHSLLDPRMRTERARLVESYDKALIRYSANVSGDKSGSGFEAAYEEFAGLADSFGKVGDLLNAGRSWQIAGACWDEGLRGKKEADLYRAYEAYAKGMEAYDKLGLVGTDVSTLRTRLEFLVTSGYDKKAPEGGGASAPVPVAAGTTINVAMAFEPVEDPEAFQRPNYLADDAYQIWSALPLAGRGSTATFPGMPESGVSVERTGAAEFTVRDAGSGKHEGITVTGNTALVRATIGDQNGKREWAFLARIGIEQDTYQGRKAHLAPSDQYLSLFYWAAASMVGQIGEETVRVFDDNMDGVYGSPPLMWQYLGVAPGAAQPDFDCILIGKSKRALPWSKHAQVGGQWYQLEPAQGGALLLATPVELETGTLKLDFDGESPEWLVLRGEGPLAESYFDLCQNGKKPIEVPVGDYRLFAGMIRKGKKVQMMKCLILGNEEMKNWTVEAGKETVVQLGGDLHFDFEIQRSGDKGVVQGKTVRVIGKAGETYDRFWNCVPEPVISLRKAGTKRGGKPEEMPKVVGDMDELNDDGSRRYEFGDVWRPMDLEIDLVRGGDAMEVQMSEKKNKLLGGPIESAWK